MTNQIPTPITKNKIIRANTFKLAEEARVRYHVTIGREFKKEDIFASENWTQVLASGFKIKIGDRIEIIREDYAFYILVMVIAVDKHGLNLKELSFVQIEEEGEEKEDSGLKIIWKGPVIKYAVIRSGSKGEKELGKGFATKIEAQNFLENNK